MTISDESVLLEHWRIVGRRFQRAILWLMGSLSEVFIRDKSQSCFSCLGPRSAELEVLVCRGFASFSVSSPQAGKSSKLQEERGAVATGFVIVCLL